MSSLDQSNPKSPSADYDFIISQPVQPSSPKRRVSLKIIILAVLVVAAISVLSLQVIVKKKTPVSSIPAGVTAKQFIADIQANNNDAAYGLIAIPADHDKTFFEESFANPLRQHYVLSKCSYETKGTSGIAIFTVGCPSRVANTHVTITLEVVTINGEDKIADYLTERP